MAQCPNCGAKITTPIKEWDLNDKIHIVLFECCGKKFREYRKK